MSQNTALFVVIIAGVAIFAITLVYHLNAMFKRRRDRAIAENAALLDLPESRKDKPAQDTAYSI